MRLIQVFVPATHRVAIRERLAEMDVDALFTGPTAGATGRSRTFPYPAGR